MSPEHRASARLGIDPPFLYIEATANTRVRLGSRVLGPGSGLQLLIGDRIELAPSGKNPVVLEVLA
ncbi:MAG: hypothetical protein ACPG77_07090 [Nannocystaceae bacterium]